MIFSDKGVVLNAQSGFLDGSGIYGTTLEQQRKLRGTDGFLNLTACTE